MRATMTSGVRKFLLTAHIVLAVGWLGATVAYLALAVAGLTGSSVQQLRAYYLAMEFIGWYVIVPFSLSTLVVGLAESLGTPWGLFRHWWVVCKFLLTTTGAIVLLGHMPVVARVAALAAETTFTASDFQALRIQLVIHAGGGLIVLLVATALSVYKPWGLTSYGHRKQYAQTASLIESPFERVSYVSARSGAAIKTPRWVHVVGLHVIGLVLLFVIMHFTGGGLRFH